MIIWGLLVYDVFVVALSGFLLHHFPLLLFTPLTPSTLHTVTKFTSSHFTRKRGKGEEGGGAAKGVLGHSWVAKSLYHNLVSFIIIMYSRPWNPSLRTPLK